MSNFSTKQFDIRTTDLKTLISDYIKANPGIRYRELLRLSGLTNGALEYHIKILEKTQRVKVDRQYGRRPRYYPLDIDSEESKVLGHIRNVSSRRIIIFILNHDLCTFAEILDHMKKAPSTISWHLKRLLESAVISVVHGQELQLYKVSNRTLVSDILFRYRDSFKDKIAIEYYEMFGHL